MPFYLIYKYFIILLILVAVTLILVANLIINILYNIYRNSSFLRLDFFSSVDFFTRCIIISPPITTGTVTNHGTFPLNTGRIAALRLKQGRRGMPKHFFGGSSVLFLARI